MPNIKPILKGIELFTKKAPVISKYVHKPQASIFTQESLKSLRIASDELCLSPNKTHVSIDEVKSLFSDGKIKYNPIVHDVKDLLARIDTPRQKIRLDETLSNKDYKLIQSFMNKDNSKYIHQWTGYSDTDIVPNRQKLALFVRTMRLTRQSNDFLAFDPSRWEMVYEGIVTKPREMIMPMFEYKANSGPMNMALSGFEKMTLPLKNSIDRVTKYLNMFTVKEDFIGYRGDKSFNILSGVKVDGTTLSLAEVLEDVSKQFKNKFNSNLYDAGEVQLFVERFLLGKKVHQPRFMSIGMTESAIQDYAKKIKWRIEIPKGTKGASIESFNVERLNEAEFLGQRNGVLKIRNAHYNPKEDMWYFDATLAQNPIDEIIVNC